MPYGISANNVSDRVLRAGAKVLILYCNGDAEHPKVNGLSVGGRRITKYSNYKKLGNFRAGWIPEPMLEEVHWKWEDKAEAERWAAGLTEIWIDGKGLKA